MPIPDNSAVKPSRFSSRYDAFRKVCALAAGFLFMAGCQVEEKKPSEPAVTTLNRDYNRLRSQVLVRQVKIPTEANLDFAAYSKNVMLADTEWKAVRPSAKIKPQDLTFRGLVRETKAILDFTPLTENEKAAPMAWTPVLEVLLKWNFEKAAGLANAYTAVTGEKWGDTSDVAQPYQEFGAVYIHRKGNVKEVWVELEFKPWLNSFMDGIADQDRDGYPEILARLDPGKFTPEMVEHITGDYAVKILSEPQAIDWARNLASRWYPSYNTDLVTLDPQSAWPYEDTPADVKKEMAGLSLANPLFILQGRPFEDTIFNAFVVEGMGAAKSGNEKRREGKPMAKGLDKGLSARLDAIADAIDAEKQAYGGGEWRQWVGRLAAFREDARTFAAQEPPNVLGLMAPDSSLVFRREIEYLLAPDWDAPGARQSPVPAITAFKDYLAERGIDFLFVPIPTKLDIHPERLSPHADTLPGGIAQPNLRKLIRELAEARVETIDLLDPFLKIKGGSEPGKRQLYQRQDTHWSTVGLEAAAQIISDRLKLYSWSDSIFMDKREYRVRDTVFENLGDIQARLSDSKKAQVGPESLLGRQVLDGDGRLYEDSDSAAVLVLGDSYTGVYQTVGCRNAGVTAHMAKNLGGPVDLIMGWGGGPEAPSKLKKRGEEYLDGKRAVVWMMSARDLFVYPGDWSAK